jgi:hypothetical protein
MLEIKSQIALLTPARSARGAKFKTKDIVDSRFVNGQHEGGVWL